MPEIPINYLAVLLAAVANIVVGTLWYGLLFGKQWKRLMGFTDERLKQMKMTAIQATIGGFVSALIMSLVLAHDAFVWSQFFGSSVTGVAFTLQLAFWIWLGYIATTHLGTVLWEGRSWKLFALNAAHSLVSMIVMAFVITFFQ